MSIPDATLTVLDGALGTLPDAIDNVHLKIGVCSSGTTNAIAAYADASAARDALGTGPLAEAVVHALVTPTQGRAARPVYAMRIATTATGAAGSVTATRVGSSTGTVATTGSAPRDSYEVRVLITRSGARGVGAFKLSLDGAQSYGSEVTIPSGGTYADATSGVTTVFDTGTFDAGDLFSFDTTEPRPTAAEYATALDAALASSLEWAFVHLVGTPPPEMTAVTEAGTTPPDVTLTGTPLGYYDLRIEITTGGARGTAVFRWSIDGGATWAASGVTTAATVVLTGTGLTAVLSTGTDYATDNVYTAHGAKAFRDRLDTAHTKMAAAETAYRYAFAVVDGPEASDSVCSQATASFTSVRVGSVPSSVRFASAISNRRYKRPAAWSYVARVAAIDPQVHPAWVQLGPLVDVLSSTRDERVTEALDTARWATLRGHIGLVGVFVTRARLFAADGSDFEQVMNRRVMDKACRLTRASALPFVGSSLRVNPTTSTVLAGLPGAPGTLDERDARRIEAAIGARLDAGLLATGQASQVIVQVNRTDNLLSTGTLRFKVRVVPLAYAETLEAELAFLNPALAAA